MALILLGRVTKSPIVPRPNRRRTVRYTDRLKALQETVDRLVAEGRSIRSQMDEVTTRDPHRVRNLIRAQNKRESSRLPYLPPDEDKDK